MKLSVWAELKGISYKTAWRLWKAGQLPVPAEQLPTGTVVVHVERRSTGVALYARVSSADQTADLDRQLVRLTEFAIAQGMTITEVVKETGSDRKHSQALMRLLRNPEIQTIVVEHRDRLMRFGFAYLEAALAAQGRRIVVIEPAAKA